MSPILRRKWPSQICRGDKLLPALSCRFSSTSKPITLLQTKPLLTAIPRAKTFSMIYSATVQMLPFGYLEIWLAHVPHLWDFNGAVPCNVSYSCPKTDSTCGQPHQSTTLRGSTHPGNQRPTCFFTPVPRFLGYKMTPESQPLPSHTFPSYAPVSTIW